MTSPTRTRGPPPLTSPVWSAAGEPYGLTCARKLGLVRAAVARVRAAGDVRVPRWRAPRVEGDESTLTQLDLWSRDTTADKTRTGPALAGRPGAPQP